MRPQIDHSQVIPGIDPAQLYCIPMDFVMERLQLASRRRAIIVF
jgi:hypothetical protein